MTLNPACEYLANIPIVSNVHLIIRPVIAATVSSSAVVKVMWRIRNKSYEKTVAGGEAADVQMDDAQKHICGA